MSYDQISRRGILACIGASAISAKALEVQPESPSLADLARVKGVLFGTSVGGGRPNTLTGMLGDPRMMALVARECGVVVPENEMKQYVVAPAPDVLNYGPGDRIAAWAKAHGMKLRGHNLLWNTPKYTPRWLATRYEAGPADALGRWLTNYVGAVARHYGSQVQSWDVVNETIEPSTGEMRDTLFTRRLGFDAIRLPFEAARARAPHAQRVYNDYMSWGSGGARHRAGVLKLLERMRSEKVPVDALGVQSHIGTEQGHGSGNDMGAASAAREREWRDFVGAVTAMGFRLLITEFDVSDRRLAGTIAERDAEVAAVGRGYLDLMLSFPQLDQVLCWGLVDRYSWLQGFSPRDDGQPLRPLPYDGDYAPKPLRTAMAQAFQAAPRR
jgi:endo-1,4-beta-xylanase